MNYELTLSMDGNTETVIVGGAELENGLMRFIGFDPHFCPDGMEDGIQFFSHRLTGIIYENSPVEVVAIKPTEEPVPTPEVTF